MTLEEFDHYLNRLTEWEDVALLRAFSSGTNKEEQAKNLDKLHEKLLSLGYTTDFFDSKLKGLYDATKVNEFMKNPYSFDFEENKKLISLSHNLEFFPEEEAKWLIPSLIPEGQITLLAADGGIGKTTVWCNLIAAISSGKPSILDPPEIIREPAPTLFLTTEDSVRKKLRRKLRIAGARLENVYTLDSLSDKEGLFQRLKFTTYEMETLIRYHKPKLCVFDPVQGFIPAEINMGSRNAMRDCMAPLISLGEECGTTFLIVCHTNKRRGAYGRERIADSADLWDISRSVLMAGFTEDQNIRYLSNEKNNYTRLHETILFSIDKDGLIQQEGTTWKRDREYMQESAVSISAPKREDCKGFIRQAIDNAGGSIKAKELEEKSKAAGFKHETIRRAKDELKKDGEIRYKSEGFGKEKEWHIERVSNPNMETELLAL